MKAHEINLDEAYGTMQHSRHRRPSDAGSADRYYGRPRIPNFAYEGYAFCPDEMTPDQKEEYIKAYNEETDRKDWGIEEREQEEE